MTFLRVVVLATWLLFAQGAAPKAVEAEAPQAVAQLGVLPTGKGPVPANLLSSFDIKSVSRPAFLDQLSVPTLANFSATSTAKPDFATLSRTQLKSTGILKKILTAKKLPATDEDKLADLIQKGVIGALSGEEPARATTPGRRMLGFWDDLVDFFEDVGCGAFATGAVAGYLAAYAYFHACNSGTYYKLSSHQKFFHRAVFEPNIIDKVNVKYSACFPPGFGSAAATTMGTEIYVRAADNRYDLNSEFALTVSSGFTSQARLLLHEMGHSLQYANRGWKIGTFGWDYMFEYCKAGFSYSKNSMEKSAETYRAKADSLLAAPVTAHFKKWRQDALANVVGYSKSAKEYTNFKIGSVSIMSLDMTKASAKIGESQRKAGTNCVRVLRTASELTATNRKLANVPNRPWDCVDVKPTKQPTKKPTTRAPTKKPTTRKPTTPPTFGLASPGGGVSLSTKKPTIRRTVPTWQPTFKLN